MNTVPYTWLRRNSAWPLLSIYITFHFVFLRFHPFVLFKTGLFASMTALANLLPESRLRPIPRTLVHSTAAVCISLLDETLMPDLAEHARIRFLLPAASATIVFIILRSSLSAIWNSFMAMTVLFLSLSIASSWTRKWEFKTEQKPLNPLFDSLAASLSKDIPVTLVLADGYPSERILVERFGIRMGLDSLLEGHSYREFQSRYISTPLSVANLLFGSVFQNDDMKFGIRGASTEVDLIRQAMEGSSLQGMLAGRKALWASFIVDEGNNRKSDMPFWEREDFRALFGKLYLSHFDDREGFNSKIEGYNGRMLADYGNAMGQKDADGLFVFLHLLTYHRLGITMGEEVAYADSLIQQAAILTPKNRKLIIFSDHGLRDPGMESDDVRSGILITSPDPWIQSPIGIQSTLLRPSTPGPSNEPDGVAMHDGLYVLRPVTPH
jgi:hypothetical protein